MSALLLTEATSVQLVMLPGSNSMAMVPVLVEASKMAEQQAKLMGQFEDVSAERIAQASALVDSLLGIKPAEPKRD